MSERAAFTVKVPALALGAMLVAGSSAMAQTNTPPPSPQTTSPTTPNTETPPGGIARGVVPPAGDVDPEIVTKPPADLKPNMPVIKPPVSAR